MRIALVFDKNREDTVGCYIERILKQSKNFITDHWQAKDVGKIPADYDLYFRIDHGDYEHDLPAHLKPSVFWALDTHLKHPFRKIMRQAVNYDMVFCAFKQAVGQMRQKGINAHWVPFACDPQLHNPRQLEKIYDLGFVGTEGKGYRPRLLNKLRQKYPNSFINKADFTELDKIYSQSKIGFNYAIRHQGKKTGCNMRFFEVLCSKSLLLTNWILDCNIKELGFENGKHLVMYRNRWQLFKLIDYYLKNDLEREKIAQMGYDLVLTRHTYKHRVEQMLRLIRENLGDKFKGLYL